MARMKTIVTMLEDGMNNDHIQAALNTDRPTVSRSLVETFRKTWEETTHLTRINEKDTDIYGHMIEQEPNHWGNSLDLDHEYEDTERTYAIFKWKNGEVFDVYTNTDSETVEHSSFDLIQTVLKDRKLHL